MQISDTEQLTNILNDLKEYFPSTRREDITEEDRVCQTVEYVLYMLRDNHDDREYVSTIANSVLFAFTDIQKAQFVNDVNTEDMTLEELQERYLDIGSKQLSLLLDAIITINVELVSKGSTYYGSVLNYDLLLKSNITVRDVFIVCGKFMDHSAHSIESVEQVNDHQIRIVVEEST